MEWKGRYSCIYIYIARRQDLSAFFAAYSNFRTRDFIYRAQHCNGSQRLLSPGTSASLLSFIEHRMLQLSLSLAIIE